jgi:hypothetical protein
LKNKFDTFVYGFIHILTQKAMIVHQLSVFLENRSGRLTEVLETLGQENIKITALSVADTSEFGILRMIVSEPEKAKKLLKEKSFTVNLTEVLSIITPNEAKYYAKALKILSDLEISIEYTYAFSVGEKSVIILRTSNAELAIKTLQEHAIELLKASDLYMI